MQSIDKVPERKTDRIVHIALKTDGHEIFSDQHKNAWVRIFCKGHYEIMPCNSTQFIEYLSHEYYRRFNESVSASVIRDAIVTISGKAQYESKMHDLSVRSTYDNGILWYDLVNSDWQVVKITKEGWKVVDEYPILFKRHAHQKEQVKPIKGGDAKLLEKYINLSDPQEKLLVLVNIISYFLPHIPRPLLYLQGQQGSAKTTQTKFIRKVVDPSELDVTTFPKNSEELVQMLNHHHVITFDNLSRIDNDMSDTLCRAITGGGVSKRKLYTDNADIFYSFTRGIVMNGINTTILKPDLLDRSIVVELDVIDRENRKTEQEVWNEFNSDLPKILGGIYDVLVQSLFLVSSTEVEQPPRMADFTLWGSCIAKALGYTQQQFLDAYYKNIKESVSEVAESDTTSNRIVDLIDRKGVWTGRMEELYQEIRSDDYETGYFPRSASALSRHIKVIKPSLLELGYVIEQNGRQWILRKHGENVHNACVTEDIDPDEIDI